MFRLLLAIVIGAAALAANAQAQGDKPTPAPAPVTTAPTLPPGIGPRTGSPFGAAGAPAMPAMPPMPNGPGPVGARQMPPAPPSMNDVDQTARTNGGQLHATPTSGSTNLITFLDATTPFVQAFDFVLMLIAGVFCLRARKAPGLTILAISCFVSAIILLGFFLFGIFHGHGAFPEAAYIVARMLAPFELLLFVVGIVIIARRNVTRSEQHRAP